MWVKTGKTRTNRPRLRLWAVLVWLIVWQIAAMLLGEEIILSSPISVLKRLGELIVMPDYWQRVLFSSFRIMAGMLLGALLGLLFGMLAYFVRPVRELMAPLISVIRAIPVVSFTLLALYWLKAEALGGFISLLICFPVFYTNTLAGMNAADAALLEMCDVFQLGLGARLRGVYLPALLPHLCAAAEVSVGLSWKSGTAAEYIALPAKAIGRKLYNAKVYLLSAELMSWTLTIVLLNSLFGFAVVRLLRLAARKWGDVE